MPPAAYSNDNGLGLTAADTRDYLRFLADTAHAAGMGIGMKNGGSLVDASIVASFDFVVSERCWELRECNVWAPFAAGECAGG
jgi:hypothetical protein